MDADTAAQPCKSYLCCEQATGLKDRLNKEKATNLELVQQCSIAEQSVKSMEDEVRLVKRQLAMMTKARDVAVQEKEDWKATCNRCFLPRFPFLLHPRLLRCTFNTLVCSQTP